MGINSVFKGLIFISKENWRAWKLYLILTAYPASNCKQHVVIPCKLCKKYYVFPLCVVPSIICVREPSKFAFNFSRNEVLCFSILILLWSGEYKNQPSADLLRRNPHWHSPVISCKCVVTVREYSRTHSYLSHITVFYGRFINKVTLLCNVHARQWDFYNLWNVHVQSWRNQA